MSREDADRLRGHPLLPAEVARTLPAIPVLEELLVVVRGLPVVVERDLHWTPRRFAEVDQ